MTKLTGYLGAGKTALQDPSETLWVILGKQLYDIPIEEMIDVWKISAKYVSQIYMTVNKDRKDKKPLSDLNTCSHNLDTATTLV